MIVKNNLLLLIIISLILYSCGYSKVYNSNEIHNFNIMSLEVTGDSAINNHLKINLKKYLNNKIEDKSYIVKINSEFKKRPLAKDKTGKITDIKLIADVKLEYEILQNNEENKITKTILFSENFSIKKNQNNFEQRDYEKTIKRNLTDLLSKRIIRHLSITK